MIFVVKEAFITDPDFKTDLANGLLGVLNQAARIDESFLRQCFGKGLANFFTPFAKARLSGGLPNDYANAGKANLLRCYDVYRETLLCGDRYFNPNFDYANPVPTLAEVPYPPIKLNPLYSG